MLQLGNDQMEGTLARMSIDHFDKEKANLSADEKAILGQIFAHTHVVGAYLLGAAGAAITKVGSLVFAWDESVGWT